MSIVYFLRAAVSNFGWIELVGQLNPMSMVPQAHIKIGRLFLNEV